MSPESAIMGFYAGSATLMGTVIGSFLNVCIARWPHDRSLLPRSACPHCNHPVRPKDLVPVLSWLWLRGKCRDCARPISPVYPMVELLMGMLGWLLFQRFILEPGDLDPQHLFVWAFYLVFVSAMVVMAFVDLRYHIIPDQTSSYSIPVGLLGVALLSWAGVEIWPLPSIKQALFGVLLGGGLLTIVSLFFGLVLGREALGWGDVKALAMIGAFLGAFPGVWSILFFASILSAIFGILHLVLFKKRDYLPFAPALALTAILHVFYGDQYLKLCFPTMMP